MPSSLIVLSSFNYYPAHQPATTDSMHLQSAYTPCLQYLSNRRRIWNPVEQLRLSFFAEIVDVLGPSLFSQKSSIMDVWQDSKCYLLCPIIHYSSHKVWGEASITGVTQRNLGLTLPPNSLDLHQTQKQKMKSWIDPVSSFRFPETVQVFSNPTPIT